MNASPFRRRISLLFAALFLTPLIAAAAPVPMDFKVLIDSDNKEATGCTVVTTAGIVHGVDHVLNTSVSFDGTTATVTGVTRQSCVDSVANTFSAAVPVATTGWSGPVTAGGNFFVETFMPLSAFGGVTNMRYVFTAAAGNLADTVIRDVDNNKIIFPPLPTFRRHASNPAGLRTITLDNNDPDWAGVEPMAEGNSSASPSLRFLHVRILMDQNNVYFGLAAQSNAKAPTANDDNYSVERGKSIGVAVPGVLSNDTDPNNKPLTAILLAGTQHGALTLNADGSFNYQNDGSQAPSDSFEYKANNGIADSNAAHVDISITEPNAGPPPVKPAFTSANNTRFQVGTPKTFTITTTPVNPAVTVTKQSGTLPTGVNFTATAGSGTGQLSGNAAPGTGGTYPLVFRATNAVGFTDQSFTLTVCNIITVGNPATTTATAGVPFSATFTQTGAVGTASFSTASALPAGLALSTGGVLSGKPTVTGTFPITVTVTDAQGCSGTGSPYTLVVGCPAITVNPPSLPNATQGTAYSQQLSASGDPGPFNFAVTAGSLPAGLTLSSSGLLSGTPTGSGTFSFTVTATTAGTYSCSGSRAYTLNVCVTPSVTIVASATTICAGTNVTFTATPVNGGASPSYQWKVNGANVGSNSNTFSSTTLANGDQVVVVMTSNATPCVTGNPATSNTITMTVNAIPATPAPSNGGPYCQGATIALSTASVSGATYSWTGPNGFTSTQQNPTRANATTADGGTYSVTVTVNGCTSAAGTTNVVVNPTPATPTASNGGPYCPGATIALSTPLVAGASYSWTGPNGFTSSQQNPTIPSATTANGGTYSVIITVNGCPSAPGTTNVVVNPTPATPAASNGGPYCDGATIALSTPSVAGASYSWTGPNGFTSAQQNPTIPNATTAAAGTYSVTVVVNGCPSAAGTTNVVVNPIPATPTASNGGPYCEGATIALSTPSVAGASYSWTGPNGFTSTQQNPTIPSATVANGGSYSVTVTVNGCTSAAGSTNVVVNPTPATPTASNGGPYCVGATIALSTPTVSGASYAWTGPNAFTSTQQNPTIPSATTANAGTYSVIVTVSGCPSAAGTTDVVVNTIPATPTASNGGPYCAGATIALSTPSVTNATYSWTGPNGFTSTQQNPTIPSAGVANGGTYSVTVTVNGCTSAAGTTNVVVNANPPTPAITPSGSTTFCAGSSVTLSAPGGYTYSWSTGATTQSIVVSTAGSYTVTVTDGNGCSATSAATVVTVNPNPPTPAITPGGSTTFCAGGSVTLSAPNGYTYLWSTSETTQSIVVSTSGSYTVTVTDGNGCSATSAALVVTVNPNPPTPTITPSGATTFCAGGSVTLSAPGGYTYLWSTNETTQSIAVSTSGSYTVTVTDGNGCSATSAATVVTVNPNPSTPTITPSGSTTFCNGGSVTLSAPGGFTYLWSTNATTQSIVVSTAGSYTVTVTDGNGCSATSAPTTVTVNSNPATPTITPGGPTTFCAGGSVTLTAPGGFTYLWSTNETTQSIVVSTSGSYTVTVSDNNGCSATSAATVVTVNPNPPTPTITPSGATTFCAGGSVTLSAPGGYTYSWSTGATTQSILVSTSGSYTVTVTDGNGCSATSAPTVVTVNPNPPTPAITPSGATTFCAGGSVTLSAPGGYTYSWSTGATTQSIVVSTSGSYTVTVTDGNGCSATSAATVVTVNPNPATPAITPSPSSVCASSTGNTASGPGGFAYFWSITNGAITGGQTSQTVTYTAGASGTVGLTLTVTDGNGCSSSNTANVTINANPAPPTITPTPAQVCAGSTGNTASGPGGFTYFWSIVNGSITSGQTSQTVTYTAGSSGTVDLTLTVTNGNGCSASNGTSVTIVASPAAPTITPSASGVCAGSTGNTATGPAGATTYSWGITNGTITSATNIQTITWTAGVAGTTTLSLTVTNATGCSASNTQDVVVNANPSTPTITPSSSSACPNSTGNTASGPASMASYSWSITNGTITGGQTSQTVTYTAGASGSVGLTLTVTNGAGCSATNSTSVPLVSFNIQRTGGGSFPAATFSVGYPAGNTFTANCTGCTGTIHWSFQSGAQPPGINLTIVAGSLSGIPSATGQFTMTVIATDTGTGCSGTASFPFTIVPKVTNDSYSNLVNNTEAYVTGGTTSAPTTPAVQLSGTIVSNDTPSNGVTVDASSVGTFATTQGGSVTIASDGTFKYTPPVTANALSSDTFTYTATSNTGTVPSIPQYAPSTGPATNGPVTVTLNLTNRVWYVDNSKVSNGNGQSQSPFNTLSGTLNGNAGGFTNAARTGPDKASDIIFVYNGNSGTTAYDASLVLLSSEQLWGEGKALVVNGNTLVNVGTKPQIKTTTAASDVVTLNDGNTVQGVTITTGTRDGIAGNTHAGLTLDSLNIQSNTSGSGLHLTSMTGTIAVTNANITGNQIGLDVNNGTAAITFDATNTITSGGGNQRAVSIQNRPALAGNITIGCNVNEGGSLGTIVNNNQSGTISFTASQTMNPTGVTITSNTGATVTFSGTLNITSGANAGFTATGGGTLNVSGTANVTTTTGAGLNITGMTIGSVAFTSVTTNGAATGINLGSFVNAGTVTVNGGTITNGAATTGIALTGTNTSLTLTGATITGGSGATVGIKNTANFGKLDVSGGSVNVNAATALDLTTGTVKGTFANVTSTAGTNGVKLNAVTVDAAGFGASAGTMSGASGSTFNIIGGSGGAISWGSNISQANAADVVTISTSNANNITFSGHVNTTVGSTGINISGSSGTYNFSDASAANASTIGGTGGGITIATETGSVSFGSAYTINAATTSFKLSGTTTANITYSGLLTNNATAGVLLDINNATAGTYSTGTINFNGTATPSLSVNAGGNTAVSSASIKNMQGTLIVNHMSLTETNNNYSGTLVNILGTNTGGTFTFNNMNLLANGNGGGGNTGKGLVMAAGSGGTLAITATGGNSSIDVGSTALSLDGTGNAITLNTSALATLSSTGHAATNGVLLTSVTGGGTLTVTGGAITGNAASAFKVSGGTASVSYGGTITQNTAAQKAIDITTITGGTLTFSNTITSNGGAGVSAEGTGGTVSITGQMVLDGASSVFKACSGTCASPSGTGLTIAASNANNTVGATTVATGPAVTVNRGQISGTMIFKTIKTSGGANAIVLSNTGSGAFSVTGTGAAGSGGTITGATGDAISLTSTGGLISFTEMSITNSGGSHINATNVNAGLSLTNVNTTNSTNHGILGSTVHNLTISGGTFDQGGAGSGVSGKHGIFITNLLGTSSVSNCTIKRSNTIQFFVTNNTATTAQPSASTDILTLSHVTFTTHTSAFAGDNFSILADSGSNMKLITNNTGGINSADSGGNLINFQASNGGKVDGSMTALKATATTAGVNVAASNSGIVVFDVFGNKTSTVPSTGFSGTGASALNLACINATCTGHFRDNTITHTAPANVDALSAVLEGSGTATIDISSNVISGSFSRGIFAQARLGTGTMNANIASNNVTQTDATGLQVIRVENGASCTGACTQSNSICLNMHNNTATAAGANNAYQLRNRGASSNCPSCVFQLQGFTTNGSCPTASGSSVSDIQCYVTNTKTNGGTPIGVTIDTAFTNNAGSCPTAP